MGMVPDNLWDSGFDFSRVVWPVLRSAFPGSHAIPAEGQVGETARVVDQVGGIDAWIVTGGTRLQGIASRVQYGEVWDSFTIRARTAAGNISELDKRLEALADRENHLVVPHYTVQAYVERRRTGDLLMALLVKTEDLFRFVRTQPESVYPRRNRTDGAEFVVVWTEDLLKAGIEVRAFAGRDVLEWHTRDGRGGVDLRQLDDDAPEAGFGNSDSDDVESGGLCPAWALFDDGEFCPYCGEVHHWWA